MAQVFDELAGPLSTADALPSCALGLVGRERMDGLVVVSPAKRASVSAARREGCDDQSLRYARALRVLVTASIRAPIDDETWVARLRELETRFEDPWPAWVAMSIFRFDARGGEPLRAFDGFDSRREHWLVLALVLAFESPDDETFAHGLAAVLVDAFDLDDDEVRAALHVGHPDSTVWDDHLAEISTRTTRAVR